MHQRRAGQDQRPFVGMLGQTAIDDGASHLVAAQHLGADVLLTPLGLALFLLGRLTPDAHQVAPHLLAELGQGLRSKRVERAEDLLDRVQAIDLRRAVTGRERLGQKLLVDLADRQLTQLLDPAGKLDQVALLLGAGQRDPLGPVLEPVDVEEPAATELL